MSESYLEIQLDQQPIELCKLLKIADLVAGGGEAKIVISEGYVLLNGEVEYQKRKKIYHNDIIEFNGETIQVVINEELIDNTYQENDSEENFTMTTNNEDASSNNSSSIHEDSRNIKAAPQNEGTAKKGKRKPISF